MESKDNNKDVTSRSGNIRSMPPVTRKGLLVLCLLAFLIASLWALRTWPSRWAWLQTIQALHQASESIDLKDFIPPPIPDEENFAAQPLIQDLFQENTYLTGIAHWNRVRSTIYYPPDSSFTKKVDLGSELEWFGTKGPGLRTFPPEVLANPGEPLLKILRQTDSTFQEIESFLSRPGSRLPRMEATPQGSFPDEHQSWALEAWNYMHRQYLLRSLAWLSLNQTELAWEGWEKIWHLQSLLDEEPGLRPVIAAQRGREFALHILWEGWLEDAWSDTQLREGEALLGQVNILPSFQHAARSQRALDLYSLQRLDRESWWLWRWMRGDYLEYPSHPWTVLEQNHGAVSNDPPPSWMDSLICQKLLTAISDADWYQACIRTCQDYEVVTRILVFKPEGKWVFRNRLPWMSRQPYNLFPLTNVRHHVVHTYFVACSLAATQAKIHAARIALLARLYQRAHGHWPTSLDDIRPPEEPFAFHNPFTDTDLEYLPPTNPEACPTILIPIHEPILDEDLPGLFRHHQSFPETFPIIWSGQPE